MVSDNGGVSSFLRAFLRIMAEPLKVVMGVKHKK